VEIKIGIENINGNYEYRMLEENNIPVFLPFRVKNEDGNTTLVYDMTSMTSLKELSLRRPLRYIELCMIIDALLRCRKAVDEYMLTPSGVIMTPDNIYYDSYRKQLRFCFFPDKKEDLFKSYTELTEFILTAIDYSDDAGVKLAYEMYAAVLAKDYEFEKYADMGEYEKYMESVNREHIESRKVENKGQKEESKDQNNQRNQFRDDENRTGEIQSNNYKVSRLSYLSVICITLLIAIIVVFLVLWITTPKIIRQFASESKTVTFSVLILSLLIYFPVINISDIRRARKKLRKLKVVK